MDFVEKVESGMHPGLEFTSFKTHLQVYIISASLYLADADGKKTRDVDNKNLRSEIVLIKNKSSNKLLQFQVSCASRLYRHNQE